MIDALKHPASSYINGRFVPVAGDQLVSTDPTDPDRVVWQGSPPLQHVDEAIGAARAALDDWSSRSFEQRVEIVQRWRTVVTEQA